MFRTLQKIVFACNLVVIGVFIGRYTTPVQKPASQVEAFEINRTYEDGSFIGCYKDGSCIN